MFKKRTMRRITVHDFLYEDVINYLGGLSTTFSISKEYGPKDDEYYKFNHRDFDIYLTDKELDRLHGFIHTMTEYYISIGMFCKKEES